MTAALQDWIRRVRADLVERRLWSNAPTVEHVAELMAWFCLGELQSWPYHRGPTCPETREADLGPVLAAACRRGYITTQSQPGFDMDEHGDGQRAAVEGLATDAVLAKLRGLTAGTRLQVVARRASRWRIDYSDDLTVTRVAGREFTAFGARLTECDVASMFGGVPDHVVDELVGMWQVAIVDPQWGAHRLLWDRLAEPDWDHPTPPAQPHSPPAAKPAPTRTTGGTATVSTSIQEIQSIIASVNDSISQGQGPIQQLIDDAIRDRARLMASMDGSHQPDVEAAVAVLTALIESLNDALQRSHQAGPAVERIGARL